MSLKKNHIMIRTTSLFEVLLLLSSFLLSASKAAAARRPPSQGFLSSNVTAVIEKHATLTLNGFEKGEDGGGASECDGHYHSDDDRIVALSTNWYHKGKLCHKCIQITARCNGKTTTATVVDECDTSGGCPADIVDGSRAVWKALGIHKGSGEYGQTSVTWQTC